MWDSSGIIHYQDELLNLLPDFDGKERALAIAEHLSDYATQAAYPTRRGRSITMDEVVEGEPFLDPV